MVRSFRTLVLLSSLCLIAALSSFATAQDSAAFDFETLKRQARELARTAYQAPPSTLPAPIADLTWDQLIDIQCKHERALWSDGASPFRVRFFHLGLYNRTPVKMYEVVDGRARPIDYDPAMFDYGKSGVDGAALPKTLGFAGFRLAFREDWKHDIAAFQGASYFRAVGGERQYGLSARGIAVDSGMPRPEEFPNFTAYYLERPRSGAKACVLYGLLDGPSVAGAYKFIITPGDVLTMDVDSAVYPRKPIERLGIAPLTSMFQCGENDRRLANDFRPEIHDSDGLSMHTGSGEWIWRPLTNPTGVRFNMHFDENPRGFGLLQRDGNFDHYQDDGVFYDRRPSAWVEPRPNAAGAGWGKGSVQLLEIPTPDETFDNIVAFWNPAQPPQPGDELLHAYRLRWGRTLPVEPPLGRVTDTRTGLGGVVGQKRKHYSWRFAIDFADVDVDSLGKDAKVEPVITASRGEIEIPSARPLAPVDGWRAIFDIKPTDESVEPINLSLRLKAGDKVLTETWLYQWTPPPPDERKF
jgi:glucans biosynthesis protein